MMIRKSSIVNISDTIMADSSTIENGGIMVVS